MLKAHGKKRLVEPSLHRVEHRVLTSRIIMAAQGGALTEFKTIGQLLGAVHDALFGYRMLSKEKQILHRDISVNNILINREEGVGQPRGYLIDLGFAMYRGRREASGARHQTGAVTFMSIAVLERHSDYYINTVRDDLESFFHVLLYVCTNFCASTGGRHKRAGQ